MFKQTRTGKIITLAWPLFIGQIALIANGVMDTVMTARFSATDLAALALGFSIYISVFIGLSGVLQALLPIVGQHFGAKRYAAIGHEVKQALWLALFLSIIGSVILYFAPAFLVFADASPELTEKATLYLRIEATALPATLAFRVYASLNTAISRPKMVMMIQVLGLLLKIPLNALFIFGYWGMPAMGGPGCALATSVIAWLMVLVCWMSVRAAPYYQTFKLFNTGWVKPAWASQKALLVLGIPMGLSYFIEVTGFTLMAIFIARLGDTAVAGHQITANMGAVLYMLPLALGSATGTLVAQSIGAGQLMTAQKMSGAGIRLAAISAVVTGCAVWLLREQIVHAYTPDPVIYSAAIPLFVYIAFYQLFDGIQVTTAFVLRAYKIAIIPTLIYAIALWGVGLGGGYLIGLDPFNIMPNALKGASGFWFANSASLAIVAVLLLGYLRIIQRRVANNQAI
jgi:MATE family multidrug resistance protein